MNPYTFRPKLKKLKEMYPKKTSYIFSKESCFYISGNANHGKTSDIFSKKS